MHADSIATKRLAAELLVACERKEFVPYFQPIVDAETGQVVSAEVLVRWQHPSRGLLMPGDFLSVAAAMGIVSTIDRLVFAQMTAALRRLDEVGAVLSHVSINVSAGRLEDASFIHEIRSSGMDPHRIGVEIIESVYLERMSDTVRWALSELAELGVSVAVDDFGTGHASLKGLLKINPKFLKIDKGFVGPALDDPRSEMLLASIISIGKGLGMKIVAEGVETDAHASLLRGMECDFLQGYFFGPPMSAADMAIKLTQDDNQ